MEPAPPPVTDPLPFSVTVLPTGTVSFAGIGYRVGNRYKGQALPPGLHCLQKLVRVD